MSCGFFSCNGTLDVDKENSMAKQIEKQAKSKEEEEYKLVSNEESFQTAIDSSNMKDQLNERNSQGGKSEEDFEDMAKDPHYPNLKKEITG
jgi:hypothetical protein